MRRRRLVLFLVPLNFLFLAFGAGVKTDALKQLKIDLPFKTEVELAHLLSTRNAKLFAEYPSDIRNAFHFPGHPIGEALRENPAFFEPETAGVHKLLCSQTELNVFYGHPVSVYKAPCDVRKVPLEQAMTRYAFMIFTRDLDRGTRSKATHNLQILFHPERTMDLYDVYYTGVKFSMADRGKLIPGKPRAITLAAFSYYFTFVLLMEFGACIVFLIERLVTYV